MGKRKSKFKEHTACTVLSRDNKRSKWELISKTRRLSMALRIAEGTKKTQLEAFGHSSFECIIVYTSSYKRGKIKLVPYPADWRRYVNENDDIIPKSGKAVKAIAKRHDRRTHPRADPQYVDIRPEYGDDDEDEADVFNSRVETHNTRERPMNIQEYPDMIPPGSIIRSGHYGFVTQTIEICELPSDKPREPIGEIEILGSQERDRYSGYQYQRSWGDRYDDEVEGDREAEWSRMLAERDHIFPHLHSGGGPSGMRQLGMIIGP